MKFKCCECGKLFTLKINLRTHAKRFHSDKVDIIAPKKTYKYQCQPCGKNYNILRDFTYHKKKFHSTSEKDKIFEKRQKCPLCHHKASKANILKHFSDNHDLRIETERLEFQSFEDFITWKTEIEKSTCSRFIKQRKMKSQKKGDCVDFYCHRSGTFVSKGKGVRHIKTQGSKKINGYCPAFIRVYRKQDKTCEVYFVNKHVGHENDVGHLTLTVKERETLANKLALEIPFQEILDEVHDSTEGSQLGRIHLLTKQDLYNIERSFNLTVRHKNDAISVDAWVNDVKSIGCVLYYKSQDMISVQHPELTKEDFALIIMNLGQEEVFKKYCSNCVCLDVTQGLNQYDFKLHTILVVDDTREGLPCALLISNRSDEDVMKIFFYYVKERIGYPVATKVFMSDMSEGYYKAWQAIMGPTKFRLFCTWDVDRSWRKNLSKITNRDKQVSTYKSLRTMLTERNQEAFVSIMSHFISTMTNDPETKDFGEYFSDHYVKSIQCWAYCYRINIASSTNTHIERMHRTIKHIYLRGQKAKRLDKAIHQIQKFVRDKLIKHLTVINKGNASNRISDTYARHEASEGLQISNIRETEFGWEIPSSAPDCFEMYNIYENKHSCNCNLICVECNVCIHKYSCTCIDSCILWNMCKHVHLLCRYLKQKLVLQLTEEPDSSDDDTHIDNVSVCDEATDISCITKSIDRTSKVEARLVEKKDKLKAELIPHLIKIIDNMVSIEQAHVFEECCVRIETSVNEVMEDQFSRPGPSQDTFTPPNKK